MVLNFSSKNLSHRVQLKNNFAQIGSIDTAKMSTILLV